MQFTKRKIWAALMAGGVLPMSAHSSNAEQAYPAKRITIVVGGSQGGGVDILSRHVARVLEQELGVTVLVENRPGAAGNIGAEHVARSQPDGYTLFVAARPNITYGALHENPRYDLRRDLLPVGLMATAPSVIVAGRDTMITSPGEMVARAKAHPLSLKCASGGVGSTGHLLCEEFQQRANVEMLHVPYTYSDQAFTHMLGGHIDTVFVTLSAALPYIRAGAVHGVAVSGRERAPSAPGIPTLEEEGFDKLHGDVWYGLVAPAGTPANVMQRLNTSLNRVLTEPQLREQLSSLGYILPAPPNTAASLERLIAEETAHWTDLIADRRIAPARH
ncbi:Bug family tripartite tricarboxylate transporter substrate binding protein [Achromobacter aloeverae]|uniref:MFS transporter n=1 Tax=Achromobacter aloeverae TaxID=1750518 RepID=A0A4Q1HMK9_9BURK|nr:tripartite tricarboxylate transporter substrate-binding protein [Achromobacter aloeverae]RXN91172.1 MFS transporter [Achromobacter aloeverae]